MLCMKEAEKRRQKILEKSKALSRSKLSVPKVADFFCKCFDYVSISQRFELMSQLTH